MRPHEAVAAARALGEAGDLERVVEKLLDVVTSAVQPEASSFYAFDERTGSPSPMARRGRNELTDVGAPVTVDGATLVARAAASATPQLTELTYRTAHGERVSLHAWALPLVAGGRAWGALLGVRATALDAEELALVGELTAVAARAAAAQGRQRPGEAPDAETRRKMVHAATSEIANALFILPAAHMHAAVLRRFQLWPTSRDGGHLPDFLRNVLQVIVRQARIVAGAEMAALGIGENPARPFDPWVVDGVPPELEERLGRHPRPVGTLGVVARDGRVVRVPRVRDHPSFVGLPAGHPELASLLGVPIRYGDQTLGNLYLANKIGAPEFSDEDEQAVQSLTSFAAIALQQTYLRAVVEAHQAHLHSIVESAPHGIVFVEAGTDRVIANSRAMSLLGDTLPSDAGREAYTKALHLPDGRPAGIDDLLSTRALRGEHPQPKEYVIVRPDGSEVPILESAAPVFGFENRVLGAVVNFEDIRPLKELERLREEFYAMVVHDLRSPIQAILMQTNLLSRRDGHEPATLERGLSRIERNARQLARIANDLLDATRIDLEQLVLSLRVESVDAVVEQAVDRSSTNLGAHEIRLSKAPTLPKVALDVSRFDQVLANLLDNAAKYSDPGAPIDVRIVPSAGGVVVSVADYGTGMNPDELRHAFDRFYRSERARERGPGLGLGLYICGGLVRAHGGRITAESTPGKGTTISVWLPAAQPPEERPGSAAAHDRP